MIILRVAARFTCLAVMVTLLGPIEVQAACIDSELTLEISALSRLVDDPALVLKEADSFWEDEPAQRFTLAWADGNGFSISRERWARRVERFAELSADERDASELMDLTRSILQGRGPFLAAALPHVCEFLPAETDTGVPIHITAFIPPRAFVTGGIVVNASAEYWKGDVRNILNTLTHEIWHVGYSRLRVDRSEPPTGSKRLYESLDQLQNEGIATYVGYRAQDLFPAPDEVDYRMLDSGEDVARSLRAVNDLLNQVGRVSDSRIRKRAWQVGVEERAFYVAGAHMARTIDRKWGRVELLQTIRTGPRSFVEAYNDAMNREGTGIELPDNESIALRTRSRRTRIALSAGSLVVIGLAGVLIIMRFARNRSK